MSTFKERIKELRLEKGMTHKELAEALGLSESAISMYENGHRIPPIYRIDNIAQYFHVTENYLLGKTDHRAYFDKEAIAPEDRDFIEAMLDSGVGETAALLSEKEYAIQHLLQQLGYSYDATVHNERFILDKNGFGGNIPKEKNIQFVNDLCNYASEKAEQLCEDVYEGIIARK